MQDKGKENVLSGVLTGCNAAHEWMLKPWWHYYSRSNTFPVTFIDFGMSKSARLWCEKRAPVISVSLPSVTPKEKIDPKKIASWNGDQGHQNYWGARPLWFAKPLALLQTPFQNSVWVDIDTFVLKPLDFLFEASQKTGIALALETEIGVKRGRRSHYYAEDETIYNMGIISYQKDFPFLKKWALACQTQTDQFLGDQDLFIKMAHDESLPINVLPRLYNWRLCDGMQDDVAIIHLTHQGQKALYENLFVGGK